MEKLAVTIKEASEIMSLGKSTVYLLVASGEWPSFMIGKHDPRIRVEDLKAWMEKKMKDIH